MNWNPNENDPWGKKNGPPDLDDAIKQLRKMFTSGGGDKKSNFKFGFKFFFISNYCIANSLCIFGCKNC